MSRQRHYYRRKPRWAFAICCPRCGKKIEPIASRIYMLPLTIPATESVYRCQDCELVWYISYNIGSYRDENVVESLLEHLGWLRPRHEHDCDSYRCRIWVSEKLRKLLLARSL